MTRRAIVTVRRVIVETVHFTVDADALDLPTFSDDCGAEGFGEASGRIQDAVHGLDSDRLVLEEFVNDASCTDWSVQEWSVVAPEGGAS